MAKKNIFMMAATLLLVGGIYYYLYRDYFVSPGIQIFHTIRPAGAARMHGPANAETVNAIIFGLGREYKLTSIKVIPAGELETNKYAHPIWHLISESNSAPTRAFTYGKKVPGMHPADPEEMPIPLLPDVSYRLFVEAGSKKGEHEFKITEESRVTTQ
jgi:hypothetical protein